jgi:hypothetical protein
MDGTPVPLTESQRTKIAAEIKPRTPLEETIREKAKERLREDNLRRKKQETTRQAQKEYGKSRVAEENQRIAKRQILKSFENEPSAVATKRPTDRRIPDSLLARKLATERDISTARKARDGSGSKTSIAGGDKLNNMATAVIKKRTESGAKAAKEEPELKTSLMAAAKAGDPYYFNKKTGKKMAAVTKEMLDESPHKTLRDYMNAKLGLKPRKPKDKSTKTAKARNSSIPNLAGGGFKPRVSNIDYRKGGMMYSTNTKKGR